MLSTGHRSGYSQGLIHRNSHIRANLGHEKAANDWMMRKGRGEREKRTGANGLSVNQEGLFTNAETGEDPSEQVIRAECSSDFPQQLLCLT